MSSSRKIVAAAMAFVSVCVAAYTLQDKQASSPAAPATAQASSFRATQPAAAASLAAQPTVAPGSIFGLLAPDSPATPVPNADSVEVGDVTGDGRDDVVLATRTRATQNPSGEVTIYVQYPGYLNPVSYPYGSTAQETALALGDLNNDGTKDIVVGHDTGITIMLSDGQGNFSIRLNTEVGPNVRQLALLDADHDGVLDIALIQTVYAQPVTLSVLFGDGAGGIRSSRTIASLPGIPQDMRAGDVTGDDAADIVLSGYDLAVYASNGVDGFNEPTRYPGSVWGYTGIAIADFNGDGLNDIATGEAKNSPTQIWIFTQKVDGTLGVPAGRPTYDIPTSLVARDLDRDGRQDLVVTHNGWFSVGYYTQESGTFGSETRLPVQTDRNTHALAAGNLAGGCDGVVMVNPRTTISFMWSYNCNPLAPVTTRQDFDHDGKTDMLWRDSAKTALAYWRMSSGEKIDAASYFVGPDWNIIATGDFDGNRHEDLIWSNGTSMQMWLGSATGYVGRNMANYPAGYRVVAVGDLDGDGNADLVWRDNANTVLAQWFMRGAAVIDGRGQRLDGTWRVAGIGDLTGDRRRDLIVASGTRMMLWEGNPNRTFKQTAMGGYPTGWDLDGVSDIDGDGIDDLLWRHTGAGYFVYWTMRGPRRTAGYQFAVDGSWRILQSGDQSGDGRADIVWTNGSSMQLWVSDGLSFSGVPMQPYPQGWSLVR